MEDKELESRIDRMEQNIEVIKRSMNDINVKMDRSIAAMKAGLEKLDKL